MIYERKNIKLIQTWAESNNQIWSKRPDIVGVYNYAHPTSHNYVKYAYEHGKHEYKTHQQNCLNDMQPKTLLIYTNLNGNKQSDLV